MVADEGLRVENVYKPVLIEYKKIRTKIGEIDT